MFCTQCGIQMPEGAKFCPACGAGQKSDAAPVAKPRSNVALKLAAAGGLVAILAAAAYMFYSPDHTPAPVAAPAPAPVAAAPPPIPTPEPKSAEPPAPVSEPPPSASAPDPAEIAAAHQALDQKIADEEAAAKKRAARK